MVAAQLRKPLFTALGCDPIPRDTTIEREHACQSIGATENGLRTKDI